MNVESIVLGSVGERVWRRTLTVVVISMYIGGGRRGEEVRAYPSREDGSLLLPYRKSSRRTRRDILYYLSFARVCWR